MKKLYAALRDEIGEGFVWLKQVDLPARCVVKISNPANGCSIYCEALQIESNFLKTYNQSPRIFISDPDATIVMNNWYRARLGNLKPQQSYSLKITIENTYCGKLRACLDHPQVIVRVATRLGIASVGLGILGLVLGI